MNSLFQKFIVLLALSVAVSSTAMAKAKDESDTKKTKGKSGLLSKKTTKKPAAKKATTKKPKVTKSRTAKSSKGSTRSSAGKEQYKNTTVNLNKASASALSAYLAGVGPIKAKAIADYRKKNGKFSSLEDLMKVEGIGAATIAGIKKNISFTRGEVSPPEGYKMGDTKKSSSKKTLGKKKANLSSKTKKTGSKKTLGKKKVDEKLSDSGDKKKLKKAKTLKSKKAIKKPKPSAKTSKKTTKKKSKKAKE